MDRGAWQATVHRITKSQTQLKQLSMHAPLNVNENCTHANKMYLLHVHTYTTKYTSDTFRMIACVEQKSGSGREI